MSLVQVPGYKCDRCSHVWVAREAREQHDLPTICPKCKSPYWNKPRKREKGLGPRRPQAIKSD